MAANRVLVLGATGGTGLQVVSQALRRGCEVTAFVRNPQHLIIKSDQLHVCTGSLPDDGEALASAVHGQDAVISTLGVGKSLKSSGLIARSMPTIVTALESQGVRRLIFTSAYGVGDTRRDVPALPRILMRLLFRDLYSDKESGENQLRRSSLDWTIVYPVTLTNGPATAPCRVGERLALKGFPTIPRANVAAFLLAQMYDATYVRKGVLISR